MRNERKYKILSLLSVVLAVLLLGTCVREPFRMNTAVYRQHEEYVLKGAKVYAENCVQCHGPRGEGVIGMPLNRADFRVDYESPAGKDVYNLIYNTLKMGRPGNPDHFQWVKVKTPEGKDAWLSYSTMPPWHKDYGGPLDEDYIKALTLFIMKPDPEGAQWNMIGSDQAPIPQPVLMLEGEKEIPLPDAQGLTAAENASAKALLRNLGKSQCLTCHTIGTRGGKIGPDLTRVGAWGIDQQFLENWIKFASGPKAMPHDERMPIYWSENRATKTDQLDLTKKVVSEGPYFMPPFEGRLADAEISLIARYLLGLK
ncbi:MAG: c-type cytochrome [Bacillota bacterium]